MTNKPQELDPQDKVTDRYLMGMLGRFVAPYARSWIIVFALLLAVTILSLVPPYLTQLAVDGPIRNGDLSGLIPFGIIYFTTIFITFSLRFAHTYLLQTAGLDTLNDIRQTLFEHILYQDMHFFNTTPIGQLVSRLSNDIDAMTELLSTSIVMVFSNLLTLIGIIVVMFALNWRLALLGLSVMPIMTVVTLYFRVKIRIASAHFHKVVAEYLAYINEQFNGMLVVQLFGRQEISRSEFDNVNMEYRNTHMLIRDQYTIFASILQVLSTLGLALILYGGGQGVLAGWATLGMLVSCIQYTQKSFEPIILLSEQFSQIQTALAAGERIARMLQVEPTIVEPEQPKQIEQFAGQISFDHVEFCYDPGTPVLRDVNIHIPAGQSVAVVGATGAGKTSLAGLLARFYDVQAGHVLIDGIDVRDLRLADLRHCVTVVPQNPYCFNGTIADNLRLFDDSITHEQMVEAAQTACAAKFIDRLHNTYDYRLLPGGGNLSQGQRQLLALARALIHSPNSVLVLDEATSNIDTETEVMIQEGLQRVLKNRTSIIIAHRLSTIREANRILVMQNGRVIEDGTHDQLLAQNGVYTRLYRRQFAEVTEIGDDFSEDWASEREAAR